MGVTSDVISSASLLLAVVAALFGMWYSEINAALAEKEPSGPVERKVVRKKIGPVLWNKALPLGIAATAIAVVFLPRAFKITCSSFALIGKSWQYDDLSAAFLLTEVILLALAFLTIWRAVLLFAKWFRLR